MRHGDRDRVVLVDVEDRIARRIDRRRLEVVPDRVERALTGARIFLECSADLELANFTIQSKLVSHGSRVRRWPSLSSGGINVQRSPRVIDSLSCFELFLWNFWDKLESCTFGKWSFLNASRFLGIVCWYYIHYLAGTLGVWYILWHINQLSQYLRTVSIMWNRAAC